MQSLFIERLTKGRYPLTEGGSGQPSQRFHRPIGRQSIFDTEHRYSFSKRGKGVKRYQIPYPATTLLYSEDFADIIAKEPFLPSLQTYLDQQIHCPEQSMLWVDLMTYLPDDILVKIDRMSMACSLEARAPLLDHKVVEFMAQVPKKHKFTLIKSKRLLRAVAARYLPDAILRRPKQGFAIPLAAWLQQELRGWLEDLLLSPVCRQRGLFRETYVRQMIEDHVRGRRDYSQQLWALMVLELWFQQADKSGEVS